MAISITDAVQVTVTTGTIFNAAVNYNLGLIVGETLTTTQHENQQRVAVYANTTEMITAGYKRTDPEVIAATIYFSQVPQAPRVAIGYIEEEEPILDAITACRNYNNEWYAFALVPNIVVSDGIVQSLASFVETHEIPTLQFYQSSDPQSLVPDGDLITNIFKTLKAEGREKSIGFYVSDITSYTAVGALSKAMGLNRTTTGTAFTLAYSPINNIDVADITTSQLQNLRHYNGNAYVVYGSRYRGISLGKMASGVAYDEVYALAVLKAMIEQNVLNLMATTLVIPQTEDGVSMVTSTIATACERVRQIGFIAPGVWNAPTVLDLVTGDYLATGYLIQTIPIDEQPQDQREERLCPDIYVCVKMAGAIEHVRVQVIVNR